MSSLLNNIISLTEKQQQQQQRIVWNKTKRDEYKKKTPTET